MRKMLDIFLSVSILIVQKEQKVMLILTDLEVQMKVSQQFMVLLQSSSLNPEFFTFGRLSQQKLVSCKSFCLLVSGCSEKAKK